MILRQCQRICAASEFVQIQDSAIQAFVNTVDLSSVHVPAWDDSGMFTGSVEQVIGWLLAYNAVNFCYWPDPGQPRWWTRLGERDLGQDDEALGIMAAFGEAIERAVPLCDGNWLAQASISDLEAILAPAPGAGRLPMMAERHAGLVELGLAYQRYGGPMGLIHEAKGSAVRLVQLLPRACPSWEDSAVILGERVRFLKRAQLATAMIYGRFAGEGAGRFDDIAELVVFADYRLPQILRGSGMMVLKPSLEARIARGDLLLSGSREEIEIRAATVHLGDRIRQALDPRFPGITALQVDHLLWRAAVRAQDRLPPFHRCRTTAY